MSKVILNYAGRVELEYPKTRISEGDCPSWRKSYCEPSGLCFKDGVYNARVCDKCRGEEI